jgi:hypothetical protein
MICKQFFEQDVVHLTPTAGKNLIDTILYNAEEFFNAQLIDLDTEMEVVEAYDPVHQKQVPATESWQWKGSWKD